ncbi:MAG: hypothetical protein NWF05_08855 [Candidatus Bathyarchaeota archaeon]|nr:hypothetical protein [Candidatus Bathyarchaeota archaeon]
MNQRAIVLAVTGVGVFIIISIISLAILEAITWQMTGAIGTCTGAVVAATIGISNLMMKQTPLYEKSSTISTVRSNSWNPLPKVSFTVSQTLLRILKFPQVGWEARNESPYQLNVMIEVHPILGGKDLHPLSDKHINGRSIYPVEPNSPIFINGCFTLPSICATSNAELILEIRATVEDTNDLTKGKYRLIPRRWKYNRRSNTWSYHPQMLSPE